jgi:fructose-1,6-bisphosphatase/inositol monophosphatase family enzyme
MSAAGGAGRVLREGFGSRHSIRYKGEVDLVTEVDERAEQVIEAILPGTCPAYGVLAEEDGRFSGESTRFGEASAILVTTRGRALKVNVPRNAPSG